MGYQICVDASLALLWLLPLQRSQQAADLLEQWMIEEAELIGPPLFDAEVTSIIRLQVYLRNILPDEGEELFSGYSALGIKSVNPPELSRVAWELAREYNQSRTYDMQYLAIAELRDCELWTADKRLVNSLSEHTNRIKWIGDYRKEPV